MKKAALGLGVLVVAAVVWYLVAGTSEGTAGPLTLYGNVEIREVALAFRRPGRLAAVAVEEGDALAAGDPVASLDDEPFRQELAAAEARVDVARARLELLEGGSRPQEIRQASAAVDEAEARLRAAESELERKRGLLAAGGSSRREVERAQEERDTAEARLASARQALDLADEGSRAEEVAAAGAELRRVTAELEQAKIALGDALLLAPSAGTVLTRIREPGSVVAAGAPIAVLSLRQPVVVRAYVSEPHLGDVPPGTAVEVRSDSSAESFRGRVGFVSPRAEFTPKSVETEELRTDLVYRLRIVVEDADGSLLQGMPVTVEVVPGTGR